MPACCEEAPKSETKYSFMKITKDTFPKYKPHSLIASLPPHLKDPANYKKIQRALLETLSTGHSHSEMEGWAKCLTCMNAVLAQKELMKRLGFKSPAQYMAWQKIHEVITTRVRGLKYND